MLAADGCASSLSNPACCFCGVWALGGPRGVAVAMFGLSLVWACSSADERACVNGQVLVQISARMRAAANKKGGAPHDRSSDYYRQS
jgi:hypothetical protein